MGILKRTQFDGLGERLEGKVRDIYRRGDQLILIATDRQSAFDRIVAHIPGKGEVLNRISAYWFENTRDIVPNHLIAVPDPNVSVVRRCTPVRVEAVMRGYLTGVTSTSLWSHYSSGRRDFGNFVLPDGMRKNQKLPAPVFTPSTKDDEHDRTVTPRELVDMGVVSAERLRELEAAAQRLFARGQEIALSRGLILVDTKYEFGIDDQGVLTLIDEVHTPDSSRWWYAGSYESRHREGLEPEYFDTEFLRLWFVQHCDPYRDATLPEAPPQVVNDLAARYAAIFTQITGESVNPEPTDDIEARIARNLDAYFAREARA